MGLSLNPGEALFGHSWIVLQVHGVYVFIACKVTNQPTKGANSADTMVTLA